MDHRIVDCVDFLDLHIDRNEHSFIQLEIIMCDNIEDDMPEVYRPPLQLIAMTFALWAIIIGAIMVAMWIFQ